MKRQRHRFKMIALLLFLCLLGVGVWAGWSVSHYGTRWFSHATNTRLASQKQQVIEGDILDRNGVVLATTQEGERFFQADAAARAAVVHIIGDRQGQIANSVETFQAGYLYGVQSSLLDAIHHWIRKTERIGNTVNLTIDSALCTAIPTYFSSQASTTGKNGAAVVLNYLTGEVVALCSLPSFDPDHVTQEEIDALNQPYWNRATQALYPPGSTFKIITSAAMLQKIPDAATRLFPCTGSLPISESFSVTEFNHAVHGQLTLRQAFSQSCNVVFATGALELGDQALRTAAEQFGFNENFLFRDLVVSNSTYPAGTQSAEALAASGYGQSAIAASPLHMCLVAAAIANDGVMPEPRLLRTVAASSGAAILRWSTSTFRKVCEPETAAVIQSMMKDTVQGGGSGARASIPTLDIRGKTGTAESTAHGQKVNYGWFIGYNGQKDLPFAVCVLVEDIAEGDTGGTTAALIARDIFSYLKNHPDSVQ